MGIFGINGPLRCLSCGDPLGPRHAQANCLERKDDERRTAHEANLAIIEMWKIQREEASRLDEEGT